MRRRPHVHPPGADARPGSPLQYLSSLAALGDPADLIGHFVVGVHPPHVPAGWTRSVHGGLTLVSEPSVPVRALVDRSGVKIGVVVGHPLVPGASSPTGSTVTVDVDAASGLDPGVLDERLHRLAGRWLAIVTEAGIVVPDANATFPAVFDAERELVSSSPFLLQDPAEPVPDDPLASVVRVFDSGLWFLFDTTSHARARRLLPNHTLDLRTWAQTRRWPMEHFDFVDPDEAIERIIAGLEGVIQAAVADAGDLNCALTGGGDTRKILAASRSSLDLVHCFTVAFPDFVGSRDVRVARRVAQIAGVEHRTLRWRAPTAADVARFMYRTGGLVGERRGRIAGPTYAQLDASRPYVAGVTTGIGNAFRDIGWRHDDTADTKLDPESLLDRFTSPRHPILVQRAAEWLAGLPEVDGIVALSLLSDELRFGNWGGALTTAYSDACTYTLYPFASREIKTAAFGAPPPYRMSGHIREDTIRLRWASLLDAPVNPVTFRYRAGRVRYRASDLVRAALRRSGLWPRA